MKRIAVTLSAASLALAQLVEAQQSPEATQQARARPAPSRTSARQTAQPRRPAAVFQRPISNPQGNQTNQPQRTQAGQRSLNSNIQSPWGRNPTISIAPPRASEPDTARTLTPTDRTGNNHASRNRTGEDNTDRANHRRDRPKWHHGDWDRHHHDRNWWRNHYTRFVIFGGGYYYWNSGFWYPAYGYDPYFSTYAYDAPIYGSNDLSPEQVMANVQTELARRGYYYGAIDGTYGPETREALLRYQQAYGLALTGMLDQATLESIGID